MKKTVCFHLWQTLDSIFNFSVFPCLKDGNEAAGVEAYSEWWRRLLLPILLPPGKLVAHGRVIRVAKPNPLLGLVHRTVLAMYSPTPNTKNMDPGIKSTLWYF